MEMVNLKAQEARPCSVSGCNSAARIQSSEGRKLGYLNDLQIFQLMETIQGDRRANVMQAPKVTMFNGQTSVVSVTDQQYFVTGVKTVEACANKQTVFVPVNQPFELGVKFALQPTVSADRRSVDLDVKANLANLASENVPVFPVTTFVTPVFEGGAQGQPIPFTQFVQTPQFECQRLDTKVNVPDGATVVYGGWKTTREVRETHVNELVQCLPAFTFVNELLEELTGCTDPLGNVSYGRESQYLVLLVTPRIIVHGEVEDVQTGEAVKSAPEMDDEEASEPKEPVVKIASSEQLQRKMVAELLAAYREACAAGNPAEAQKLAHMALALDPMCFHGGR
jgi:Flp pilus assembly secretin CpaC